MISIKMTLLSSSSLRRFVRSLLVFERQCGLASLPLTPPPPTTERPFFKSSSCALASENNDHDHDGWDPDASSMSRSNDSSSSHNVRRTTNGYAWPNLYDEAHDMMMASFVSYPITFILRQARAGRLQQSDRILAKLKAGTDGDMTTALHPHDFLQIVRDNYDYIAANYPLVSRQFGWYSVLKLYQKMEHLHDTHDNDSIALMEFDDKHETTRLVYGIGVNKQQKRITVIFRGTYAEHTRDWFRNFQFGLVDVPLPEAARDQSQTENDNVQEQTTKLFVHRGIYEYLLHNSERGPDYPRERYQEILSHVLRCLQQYPDYRIFVTGHSLGGALALLWAFFASTDDRIPKPVTCLSLGSLMLGDAAFQKSVEQLEALGWLRHLSVTNQHDPVPCLPPFDWYKPVGMQLKLLHKQGHVMGHHAYSNNHRLDQHNKFSALWESFQASALSSGSIYDWLKPHMVPEYLRRLERERPALEKLYLNDCYRNMDIVGSNFQTRL